MIGFLRMLHSSDDLALMVKLGLDTGLRAKPVKGTAAQQSQSHTAPTPFDGSKGSEA